MSISEVGCDDCNGACCKRVDLVTREIHVCQYLDADNRCSIFEDRPLACRIGPEILGEELRRAHCYICQVSIKTRVPMEWIQYDKQS